MKSFKRTAVIILAVFLLLTAILPTTVCAAPDDPVDNGKPSAIKDVLNSAFAFWGGCMEQINNLLTVPPDEFKGGGIWNVVKTVSGVMQSMGAVLLVIFAYMGLIKTAGSYIELKRPEVFGKVLVRLAISEVVLLNAMDLLLMIMSIAQSIIKAAFESGTVNINTTYGLTAELSNKITSLNFIDSIGIFLIACVMWIVICLISIIALLQVYQRFFKVYLYAAFAPIPLSTFGGQPTADIGKAFVKSYAGVCLEGVIIILACILFTAYKNSGGASLTLNSEPSLFSEMCQYGLETILNMGVFIGIIKTSSVVIHQMLGL